MTALPNGFRPNGVRPNIVRRAIHQLVYGLCAVVIGITPPTEKQELPFFFILVAFVTLTALGMYFAATVLPKLF